MATASSSHSMLVFNPAFAAASVMAPAAAAAERAAAFASRSCLRAQYSDSGVRVASYRPFTSGAAVRIGTRLLAQRAGTMTNISLGRSLLAMRPPKSPVVRITLSSKNGVTKASVQNDDPAAALGCTPSSTARAAAICEAHTGSQTTTIHSTSAPSGTASSGAAPRPLTAPSGSLKRPLLTARPASSVYAEM